MTQIRARDLGDRMILLGTEQGVEPPLCLVGEEYERWKGRENDLDCFVWRAAVGEAPLRIAVSTYQSLKY